MFATQRNERSACCRFFFVDNIFVELRGKLFQEIVGISIETNSVPLLGDLLLFLYESDKCQKQED